MHAEGFVKVLIDLDGNIEGCHIVGPEASNLIEEVVVAMTAGSGTVADIRDAVHIHPALRGRRPCLLRAVLARRRRTRPPPPFVTRHRMATRRRRHTSAGGFCTGRL